MLLRDLASKLGPHLGGTPLDGVLDLEGFPLVYKGFLHYTLPGEAPIWGIPYGVPSRVSSSI